MSRVDYPDHRCIHFVLLLWSFWEPDEGAWFLRDSDKLTYSFSNRLWEQLPQLSRRTIAGVSLIPTKLNNNRSLMKPNLTTLALLKYRFKNTFSKMHDSCCCPILMRSNHPSDVNNYCSGCSSQILVMCILAWLTWTVISKELSESMSTDSVKWIDRVTAPSTDHTAQSFIWRARNIIQKQKKDGKYLTPSFSLQHVTSTVRLLILHEAVECLRGL